MASSEATALELVGYADRCGGLNNVASVLAELAETLQPQKLVAAAHVVAPLVRAEARAGAERIDRWKLAVNAALEAEP